MCCRSNNATASVTADQKHTDPLNATQSRTSLHLFPCILFWIYHIQARDARSRSGEMHYGISGWCRMNSFSEFSVQIKGDGRLKGEKADVKLDGHHRCLEVFYTLILNLKTLHCCTISSTVQTQRGDQTEPLNCSFERIADLNLGFEKFMVV